METEVQTSFCRLCLSTSAVYNSLQKNNGKEMLVSLTGLDIGEEYSYSTESCVKCWLDLKSAYQIQQRFLESEKKLQLSGVDCVQSRFQSKKDECNASPDSINISDFIKIETDVNGIENNIINEDTSNTIANAFNLTDNDNMEYNELILIHTDEENNIPQSEHICFICGLKSENDCAHYTHMNYHFNVPQLCDICLATLPNISAYRTHIEGSHPEQADKTYCCGICSLSFKYLSLYELHLATVHPDTAKTNNRNKKIFSEFMQNGEIHKCDECNKSFRSKQSYNCHVKGHVRKPCPICGAQITIYNLSKHITNHQANPAVCHLCGITSKNPESLRGHMYYTHSQKRLKCETCGRIFKKLYAYKMHIKKEHTGERSFTCDTCGKRFFTNYELNNHIRSRHLKERKHICQYCNRGFSSRFSMRTHERQHTNEAPYVCEVCGEGFRQNVSLRAHRKSKHNIVENKQAECTICGKMFRDDWALKSHTRSVHD